MTYGNKHIAKAEMDLADILHTSNCSLDIDFERIEALVEWPYSNDKVTQAIEYLNDFIQKYIGPIGIIKTCEECAPEGWEDAGSDDVCLLFEIEDI